MCRYFFITLLDVHIYHYLMSYYMILAHSVILLAGTYVYCRVVNETTYAV